MLCVCVTLLFACNRACAHASTPAATGLQRDVVFTAHAPLARNDELLRRLLSPLNALRVEQGIPPGSGTLHAWPLDPSRQHFALYVPPGPPPPSGYALLVFVPPWNDARVPPQWIPVLDRTHAILVTAAGSGNDTNVLGRREPLALLAAYNVVRRYRVDPARVYIGGFSGGSRIALRLALGYPDLFRGAFLDAGSDPIGNAEIPLPPTGIFRRFQSSRIVFLTGDGDVVRQAQLVRATESLAEWCVFDTDSITLLHTDHALADAEGVTRALEALARSAKPDNAKIEACRARISRSLDAGFRHVQTLADRGNREEALQALDAIDAQYGGLAAPRSVLLLRQLQARPAAGNEAVQQGRCVNVRAWFEALPPSPLSPPCRPGARVRSTSGALIQAPTRKSPSPSTWHAATSSTQRAALSARRPSTTPETCSR